MNQPESPDTVTGPAGTADDSPYALFRNRDFAFFLVGRFIAVFGLQMLSAAVDWEIYQRMRTYDQIHHHKHSALALGLSLIGLRLR